MADDKTKGAVVGAPDHDRVVGLSIRKDGTLDQHDPEIIGDVEAVTAATKEQFAQMAVAAVDNAANAKRAADEAATGKQDPTIEARSKEHKAAAEAAERRAEQVVKALS